MRHSAYKRLFTRAGLLCAILSCISTLSSAAPQSSSPGTGSNGNSRQFEVASVKENLSGDAASSNIPLDRSDTFSPTGGTFTAINQPFIAYLIFAYKVKVSEFRGGLMRSLPAWAVKDRFDIVAKSASTSATKDDMRLMVQSLLAERFNLKVHREDRQLPVLAMHPMKIGVLGPQLKAHSSTSSCVEGGPSPGPSALPAELVGRWPSACGDGLERRITRDRVREGGRAMTMDQIADWLTGAADLAFPIVNRSGLSGTFDFVLEFVPEKLEEAFPNPADNEPSGPNFQEAIEDQLGIQLKKETAAIPLFFVDNVEYPSPN